MEIRKTTASDLETILSVNREAFGEEDVPALVNGLLKDKSAEPIVSLLAFEGDKAVGYILFTRVSMKDATSERLMFILAPLAVIPEFQKQGIGKQLTREGLNILGKMGTDLIFVLGHPEYYPRFGFKPAGALGYVAPYPIPEKNADAWMILGLNPVALYSEQGTVVCADALDSPEHWKE